MRTTSRWPSTLATLALVGTSLTLASPVLAAEGQNEPNPNPPIAENLLDLPQSGDPAEGPQSDPEDTPTTQLVPTPRSTGDPFPSIESIRELGVGQSDVTTEGWVTATYPTGGLKGFVIQSPGTGGTCDLEGTSDAIFIYAGNNAITYPSVGEYVQVTGNTSSYGAQGDEDGLFQISLTSADAVSVQADTTGIDPAEPISCPWPETMAERDAIESMLYLPEGDFAVTNNYDANQYGSLTISATGAPLLQPTDVAPYGTAGYDQQVSTNYAKSFVLDDGSTTKFANGAGKNLVPPYVSAEGATAVGANVQFKDPLVVDFRNGVWTLNPTEQIETSAEAVIGELPADFTYTRPAAPTKASLGDADLVVGGFNLENYFPTTGDSWAATCTSYKDRNNVPISVNRCPEATVDGHTTAGPRGAWDAANLANQTSKLVSAINTLDASALGVMELENSYKLSFGDESKAGASAQYLVDALNDAAGYEKWDFITPNLDQSEAYDQQDVMYPGIIYQPEDVTPIGPNLILGDQSDPGEAFSNARAPFGQAFEPADGGRPFFLVANHFKSKSSPGSGDEADNGQGGWNASRTAQANALANWIDQDALPELETLTGKVVEDVVLVGDFNSYTFEDPMLALYAAGYQNLNVTDGMPENSSYNYSGLNGSLDHVLISSSAAARTTGHAIWNINSPESIALDFNRLDATPGDFVQDTLGEPYRSSDHDPAVVGFDADDAGTVDVNLLNINDFHGRIDGTLNPEGDALTASPTVNFAWTIEDLREQYGSSNTLFLSAGDNVGASLFPSSIEQDQPTIDLLNTLGLAASAVGNHEFDAGWQDLRDRLQDEFDAPLLGANVYLKGTDTPALPEYAMLDAAGLRVAVIGAVTEETPTLVNPQNVADVDFGDPVEAVNRVAAELMALPEDERPDLIVAEYHEGAPQGANASTLEEQVANSPVFASLVNDTSADVDAIFTGHTHQAYAWEGPVPGVEGKTRPVVSTGSYGVNVGQVILTVDQETGDVVAHTERLVPVAAGGTMEEMRENPTVEAAYQIILAAMQNAREVGDAPTGTLTAPITRAYTDGVYVDGVFQKTEASKEDRGEASPLATLVGNMLRDSMSSLPTPPDIGVLNPGGLRTDLVPDEDGNITVAQARAVLPFNNELTIATVTGQQFIQILEEQWQRTADGEVPSRDYLQLGLSDNVTYTYTEVDDPANPGHTKGIVNSVTINGLPIDPAAEYRIGTFSFLSAGGDNFHTFADSSVLETGLLDWEAWLNYLETSSPITPDFARAGVQVEGLAAGQQLMAGEELTVNLSRMDIPAVGAPANTSVSADFQPAVFRAGGESVPVTDGAATLTLTVPDGINGPAMFSALADPTGTQVLIPVLIGSEVEAPTITVDPTKVQAGKDVTINGKDWFPGTEIKLSLGENELGTATAGEDGSFSVKVTIPKTVKAGSYLVTAFDLERTATASLQVTAVPSTEVDKPKDELPKTGANIMWALILAAAATAGGVTVVRRVRADR